MALIEEDGKQYDIYSRLLKDRILFLGTDVNEAVCNDLIAKMLFLSMDDPTKDIHLYINSPGGHVTDGMALVDTMDLIRCDVNTYSVGLAASMGAMLLSSGTKGKRFALKSSTIMIHQPLGGASGQASDVEIRAGELLRWKKVLTQRLADNCGKTFKQVEKDTDRDNYMTAEQALKYGIIDKIL